VFKPGGYFIGQGIVGGVDEFQNPSGQYRIKGNHLIEVFGGSLRLIADFQNFGHRC
jgi:hypothetical protein